MFRVHIFSLPYQTCLYQSNLSIHLSDNLFFCLSIHISVSQSVCPSIHLIIHLFIYLSIFLSIHLSIHLSVCSSASTPDCLSVTTFSLFCSRDISKYMYSIGKQQGICRFLQIKYSGHNMMSYWCLKQLIDKGPWYMYLDQKIPKQLNCNTPKT